MNKLIKNSKDNALLFRRPLMVGLILGLSFPTAPLTLQAAQKTIIEISEEGNITLVVKKKSLRSVLSDIEKNSKYVFGYNSNLPYLDNTVSVSLNNATIQQTMDAVLKGLPLTYELSGRQVLLVEKNSKNQVEKVISGRVVDENNEPLIGVNVQSGSNGTITDVDGKFTLKAKGTVTFSYIGYKKQHLSIDNCKEVHMKPMQETLDEVVVTALGMKRSEKALGYSTQKVSGDLFEKVKGTNVATSLTGRISGLTVFNTTEFNEAPTLSLRGETPLLVLDGVPTNLNLSDINQDDIETIDVLKGATASALYGSRGGSGVIMITTKKGAEKKGFTVTVNSSNMINAGTLALPKVQSSYSSGYGGKYNVDDEVWGDKLDIGRTAMQYDPKTYQLVERPLISAGKDNFKNFTEFSMISNTSVSVTQQGENGSFRSSLSYLYNKGQYPNAKAQQFTYNVGGEMRLGKKVKVEGTMGFTKMVAPQTAGTGYDDQGYIYNLLVWTGPEYDIRDYRDYWATPEEKQNWMRDSWYDNPYLMAYEKINRRDNSKYNGMLNLTYEIKPWLKAIVRGGFDNIINSTKRHAPIGINATRDWGNTNKGYYNEKTEETFTANGDFILTAQGKIKKFTVDGLLGGSIYYYRNKYMDAATKNGITVPGFYSLKASVASPTIDSYLANKQVNSLYGKVTIGYDNAVYLDITGRNDWSSTLPDGSNSYFYPSVGASLLLSELFELPSWMNFWKLRASWTVSKSDLSIYETANSYKVENDVWDGLNTASYPVSMYGNVKPITNRTYEIGTSMHFLNNRLKADFTYYNKLTYNNTIKTTISSMSGFESVLVNTDEEYVRRGFEVVLEGTPIQTKDFTWKAVANWALSHRYYSKLDPKYSADKPWIYEGSRADHYTAKDFQRSSDGSVITVNGYPQLSKYYSKVGNMDPNWTWGLTNTLKYKDFTLSFSIDGRVGGLSLNKTNRYLWQTGAHPDTDNEWRYDEVVNGNKSYVADGVTVVSGSATYDAYGNITSDDRVFEKNTTPVSYEQYIKNYWRKGSQFITDETFIKLREVSITYDIPKSFSKKCRLSSSSVSLIGQNLLLWTKDYKFADPDRATDDLNSPSVRYVGVNLKLEF